MMRRRRFIRRASWGWGIGGIILLCIVLFFVFRVMRWL
jgi:hypothetical protein